MMRDERILAVGGFMLCVAACSAGKAQRGSGDAESGGTDSGGTSGAAAGGSAGSGGVNPSGGTAAMAGTGAGAPMGGSATGGSSGAGATSTGGSSAGTGSGGVAGAGAVPSAGAAGAGGQVACQDLTVVPTELVPTVMIVVDNSSSMYEPRDQLWDALYAALMNPTTGAVKSLEAKVRFGFASYRGVDNQSVPETDNACAEIERVGTVMQATVAPALNNHAAIDTVYQALGVQGREPNNSQWETPTGHAINRIAATLRDFDPEPPGPKYILLVTDGNPNTCMIGDPQCGQDVSVKAVQDAFAAGVGTIPLGIGDIVTNNAGCTPTQMRCGTAHLQDIVNAGMGLAVEPPPTDYWYQSCAVQASGGTSPGTPLATYAAVGMGSTTNAPLTASNPTEIRTKLTTLLTNVVSCTIQLDATVSATADPSLARISVGGTAVPYDTADGWVLESTRNAITLQGASCSTFRAGAAVNVVFPCQNGRPIGT
jgi:hypothetical protein